MFYSDACAPHIVEEPCRSALNRVKGMPFAWSLNPYTGCAHRCTFCYVRAFERRADRPADDRYGRTIRVKTNIADVLRARARPALLGARGGDDRRRDRSLPAGRGALPADARVHRRARATPGRPTRSSRAGRSSGATSTCSRRPRGAAEVSVNVSVPTLDDRVWRTTEPGTAPPRRRLEIVRRLVAAGIRTNVAIAPILPGSPTGRSSSPRRCGPRAPPARTTSGRDVLNLRPGTREHFLEALARDWPRGARRGTSGSTRAGATCRRRETAPGRARSSRRSPREHASERPARRCGRRPDPTQLTLV